MKTVMQTHASLEIEFAYRPIAVGDRPTDDSGGPESGSAAALTTARSAPGAGSSRTASRNAEPKALTEGEVAPNGKHLRILVVEDNRDAAQSLRIFLELLGHEVAVAYTGPEGFDRAVEWHPQVILSDIGLPGGLDGWALARKLRSNPSTARVRLIAITGYGSEEDQRRSREAKFDRHLTKPVDPVVLQEVIAGE
jgi:CheY-like chemotaxis protein